MTSMDQTARDAFRFYAEVRITLSPRRPEPAGRLGAILGITEPNDPEVPPAYAVMAGRGGPHQGCPGKDAVWFTGRGATARRSSVSVRPSTT